MRERRGGELPERRSSRCVFARAITLCTRSSGDWAAPGAPQDVFGLEVAVHHALGVHVLQREQDLAAAMRSHDKGHLEKAVPRWHSCASDLASEIRSGALRQRPRADHAFEQVAAAGVLHH